MKKCIYVQNKECGIQFTMFPNEKKEKGSNQPDFKSFGGFAAWIREYDENKKKEEDKQKEEQVI